MERELPAEWGKGKPFSLENPLSSCKESLAKASIFALLSSMLGYSYLLSFI